MSQERKKIKIALIEPFYGGSHKQWAEELYKYSRHEIRIFSLSGHHWKWRMHGGAITLGNELLKSGFRPDLILATDMLDVSVFLGVIRNQLNQTPVCLYFHENQISYPWSPNDQDVKAGRNHHYGFINYTSALTANHVFFNSQYHLNSFINGLNNFLRMFPDHQNLESLDAIRTKSSVLPLAIDLQKFDKHKTTPTPTKNEKIIVWNHRWEYDKNPESLHRILRTIKDQGNNFKLCLLGQKLKKHPPVFDQIINEFSEELIHVGYAENFEDYAKHLWKADITISTSIQEFFGISSVEAIYCECIPLLPNRLSYPQHVSRDYLYDNEEEAISKLNNLLDDSSNLTSLSIENYDWGKSINLYDDTFQSCVTC